MTPKERWLATLRLQSVDRLLFWPKLDGAYSRAQTDPFRAMDANAITEWTGSDQHRWVGGCVRELHTRCAGETTVDGVLSRTCYHTPQGAAELVQQFDEGSQSWHPVAFPIKSRDDLELMTAWYEDVRIELDVEMCARARENVARIGQTALTTASIGTSPFMQFIETLAGVENAHLLAADYPDEVAALLAAMHRVNIRHAELMVEHSPADLLYLIENTSTTLLSPQQFAQYCLPHLREYSDIARRAGRLLALHMCGHLHALLPLLATLPVAAFEAFTSSTLGNTTLLDGRTACPHVCLIGGTNAMLWLQPPAEIIAQLERDLTALPHHRGIVVSSAGVMPPRCPPETIRAVCAWVKAYEVSGFSVQVSGADSSDSSDLSAPET